MVQDGDTWNIRFVAEEADGLCAVFIPEAPLCHSGELKIVSATSVKKTCPLIKKHSALRILAKDQLSG